MAELKAIERGRGALPLVFLHGFGASHRAWLRVLDALDPARHAIAYDLPGHAGSLSVRHGSAGVAAGAVLADLAARGIERAHLVGHSMGGAAAALAALCEPGRVAALTLAAPGGFGPQIDAAALRRYAAAQGEAALGEALVPFFAGPVPEGLAAPLASERAVPGAAAALATILDTFFLPDGAQKCLPLDDLARRSPPVTVVWGAEDRILPAAQADRLPPGFDIRILPGAGHMLPEERPAELAEILSEGAA